MVSRLHDAGIEVILDVVYNHTAEGNHLGPTLSFRGIDNASYYWLMPDKPRYYDDFTGCGNALNLTHPRVLQMVMDSLRYWVEACHVDGFRFDLATTLGRGARRLRSERAAFFAAIRQDPVLGRVKLIAEPWDIGLGGYQVGEFPPGWSEWNDAYRKTLRRFWRGDAGQLRRTWPPADRLGRHVPSSTAARRAPASITSRCTTASRSPISCSYEQQAQRGQRRGQPRRLRRQHQHQLRRRRSDRRSGDHRRGAASCGATQLACLMLGARRAAAARRRRGRQQPGRQQQRLLPGQRDRLGRLVRRSAARART